MEEAKNYKSLLFELIRKEEVIIWAGAGLSLYAGFPSGNRLSKMIYEKLSSMEKLEIDENLPLSILTEEFFRIKDNDMTLITEILRDAFINFTPTSIEHHKKIASIPHFKTIITTNYDRLFEDAYADKAQVVISSAQIPRLQNKKIHIFKIHGDLSDESTIILKNSDYEDFFENRKEQDIFWTSVKDLVARNSILFLGYNLEDINTRVLFQRITKVLANNRKPCFMVSPNQSRTKINDLTRSNIHYINEKAEDFITELLENIKQNIYKDHENGWVSITTFKDFIFHFNVVPEIKVQDGLIKISGLKGMSDVVTNLNFSLNANYDFINDFQDFAAGKKIGTFEISSSKIIKSNFNVGGINWPVFNEIDKIIFKSIPKDKTLIDVRFENEFELNNISAELYGKFPYFEVHVMLKSAVLKLNLKLHEKNLKADIDFMFTHNEDCVKIKDEIEQFEFLKNLGDGKKFSVFKDKGKLIFTEAMPSQDGLVDESSFYIEYFRLLKKIENHYNFIFPTFKFNAINQKSYDLAAMIGSIINNEKLNFHWDKIQKAEIFEHTKKGIELLKKINDENAPIVVFNHEEEKIQLHGVEINLGYKRYEIVKPYITNLKRVLAKKEKEIKIISQEKKVLIYYSKEDNELKD